MVAASCTPATLAAGLYLPNKVFEPFAPGGAEFCGVCNYTEAFGQPLTWGWSDTACIGTFISMCRIQSGWQQTVAELCPGYV
jgi:hypothetical protein